MEQEEHLLLSDKHASLQSPGFMPVVIKYWSQNFNDAALERLPFWLWAIHGVVFPAPQLGLMGREHFSLGFSASAALK